MIDNKYLLYGRDEDFSKRELEIEEVLFEGKWLLKLMKKHPDKTEFELLNIIESKKEQNKKLRELTLSTLD